MFSSVQLTIVMVTKRSFLLHYSSVQVSSTFNNDRYRKLYSFIKISLANIITFRNLYFMIRPNAFMYFTRLDISTLEV